MDVCDFSQFVGQKNIIDSLRSQLVKNEIGHAYLFFGPEGQGKSTLSQVFASSILCKNFDNNKGPCGVCLSCQKVLKGIHPDLIYIGEKDKSIKIEDIRKIKHSVSYQPTESDKKIFLINNVENMTRESANSILKVLEEPPEYVIFLLTANELQRLLSTVTSRCETYHLTSLKEFEVREVLNRQVDVEEEELKLAVSLSNGLVGRGLAILKDESYQKMIDNARKITEDLSRFSRMDALKWAEEIDNSDRPEEFLELINILLKEKFFDDQKVISRDMLYSIIEIILHTKGKLLTNVNRLLTLEAMFLEIKEVINNE
ncbi:DNA polymerase III subunit delta' [Natranaerobius trueperi]|uniref:DNA polymerase III subunit delta n=2 Tax=Natranaerobius trueperi TaxID=759412 RepID=A0A226BZU5_9FIRM|nr:DNA polymerase III subunit delta' [Natranaerobius trueperi]